jgi:hypothetical protein
MILYTALGDESVTAYYNQTPNGAFRLPLQRSSWSLLGSWAISARLY